MAINELRVTIDDGSFPINLESLNAMRGVGIESIKLNSDYTLTFKFTDGTSETVGPIRGATGAAGNGIKSTVLNGDYTLTFTFTNGSTYTTPSIRGKSGSDATVTKSKVIEVFGYTPANSVDVQTNAQNITKNTNNIATNTSNIAQNTSSINTLSKNKADKTEIPAKVSQLENDSKYISGITSGDVETAMGFEVASKEFVNSSIATNTANFIGTFQSVSEMNAYTGTITNNDYAFVIGKDSNNNSQYSRYKYSADSSEWQFEYVLNNSSFTSEQWGAIQSGITSALVTKLNNDYTKAEIDALIESEQTARGNKDTEIENKISGIQGDIASIEENVSDIDERLSTIEESGIEGFVKNTDYASDTTGGVFKTNSNMGTSVDDNGVLEGVIVTDAQYPNTNDKSLISKGTLDNVISSSLVNKYQGEDNEGKTFVVDSNGYIQLTDLPSISGNGKPAFITSSINDENGTIFGAYVFTISELKGVGIPEVGSVIISPNAAYIVSEVVRNSYTGVLEGVRANERISYVVDNPGGGDTVKITSVIVNPNGTLTFKYSDSTKFTTVNSVKGDSGVEIVSTLSEAKETTNVAIVKSSDAPSVKLVEKSDLEAHTENDDIHVTSENKTAWDKNTIDISTLSENKANLTDVTISATDTLDKIPFGVGKLTINNTALRPAEGISSYTYMCTGNATYKQVYICRTSNCDTWCASKSSNGVWTSFNKITMNAFVGESKAEFGQFNVDVVLDGTTYSNVELTGMKVTRSNGRYMYHGVVLSGSTLAHRVLEYTSWTDKWNELALKNDIAITEYLNTDFKAINESSINAPYTRAKVFGKVANITIRFRTPSSTPSNQNLVELPFEISNSAYICLHEAWNITGACGWFVVDNKYITATPSLKANTDYLGTFTVILK